MMLVECLRKLLQTLLINISNNGYFKVAEKDFKQCHHKTIKGEMTVY